MKSRLQRKGARQRANLFKALSHDVRAAVLGVLAEWARPASPSEIARELGEPVTEVSHHCKQLVRYGCAEMVEERPRGRRTLAHLYRPTNRPLIDGEEWEAMAKPARAGLVAEAIQLALGDIERAFRGGTMGDETDQHMTRHPMLLDERGRAEVLDIHRRAFEETMEAVARSDGRRAKNGEQGRRFSVSQWCFDLPSD